MEGEESSFCPAQRVRAQCRPSIFFFLRPGRHTKVLAAGRLPAADTSKPCRYVTWNNEPNHDAMLSVAAVAARPAMGA